VNPAERQYLEREDFRAALESVCPNVLGNPYMVHLPHPKQAAFLGLHLAFPPAENQTFEALYGGAAGGGKSDALLMAAAQYAWKYPGFHGLCMRRSYAELAQPGALMDRACQWWRPCGAHWNSTEKLMTFPNGARLKFGYHGHDKDEMQYQGAEYHYVGFDELTHWENDRAYLWVGRSRMRRGDGSGIPLRCLSTANPGGPGHSWVRHRFVGGPHPESGRWEDPLFPFLPATIDDNASIDRESYVANLMHLHPTRRDQLLKGDWNAREQGDYFRSEWFGPLLDPEHDRWPAGACTRIRWWDLAASEKDDACYTAGVLMARHVRGVRAIEHVRRFRATPGKRDDLIVQTAKSDGHTVIVGIEIEGGSGGEAQFETLGKRLKSHGFRCVGKRPRAMLTDREGRLIVSNPIAERGKAARADPVASCLERGYQRRGECVDTGGEWWGLDIGKAVTDQQDGIRMFAGPWNVPYLDEVELFPTDGVPCDQVDATSGAWAWLEAHSAGTSRPVPMPERKVAIVDGHALREDRFNRDKDRRGRWLP